eukprot:SAG22_NODE_402_length_11035_cov_6.315929_3_plen_595_part_00
MLPIQAVLLALLAATLAPIRGGAPSAGPGWRRTTAASTMPTARASVHQLANDHLTASFDRRGLTLLETAASAAVTKAGAGRSGNSAWPTGHGPTGRAYYTISHDEFELQLLDGTGSIRDIARVPIFSGRTHNITSSLLPAPTTVSSNRSMLALRFVHPLVTVDVVYTLPAGRSFLSKQLVVRAAAARVVSLAESEGTTSAAAAAPMTVSRVVPVAGLVVGSGRRSQIGDGHNMASIGNRDNACASAGSVVASSHFGYTDVGPTDYAGFLRFSCAVAGPGAADTASVSEPSGGLMLAVANPYLHVSTDSLTGGAETQGITISYVPAMHLTGKPFECDAALLGAYDSTGILLDPPATPLDVGERDCFSATVAQLATTPQKPDSTTKIHIGWTENDYQVDVATDAGRTEYERIVDRCSQLGITHLLYTARDSHVSGPTCIENYTYAPDCELDLWFTLGEQLRAGTWVPGRDPVPPEVQAMLDYAEQMGVKLVAYAVPIAAWLAETNPTPPWIRNVDTSYYRTTLADPAFQDFFVQMVLDFVNATGAGGISFDFNYLVDTTNSTYAQWSGWRTILHRICSTNPEILVHNEDKNYAWGP